MKCHSRVKLCHDLKTWYNGMGNDAKACLQETGLRHLPFNMFENIDTDLLFAFVERWQPDTNSFHLPFGEMTIMLHYVQHILSIALAEI